MAIYNFEELKVKFKNKNANVGVIGLGYVGLPLAVEMAEAGFSVTGIDIDQNRVHKLNQANSYILDVSNEKLEHVIQKGLFQATTNYSEISNLDAISICVPTPLNENQEPDISYIESVVNDIRKYFKKSILIILESTTFPGTTEEIIQLPLEKDGYTVGEDFYLCFSPERVDPSNSKYNTKNTPKVLGGTTEKCKELGYILYSSTVNQVITVNSTKTAEMCKLLENTFRSVNIAFINEIALMCEKMQIDVWEVIKAASTKPFGFMPFSPGPGIGGHCIPLDPMYLSWKAKEFNFFSKFIELSQSINLSMPDHVTKLTQDMLNDQYKSLKGSKILLLGLAYKPNIDDLRESPGLYIYELLRGKGASVDFYDPHAKSFINSNKECITSIEYDEEIMKSYDGMILITNHNAFDYTSISELGVPILDTRNAFEDKGKSNIYRLGA